ncbi:LysR family transcriptional regulator [Neorhizobium sp. CSC1952]|uniref:LysR family transcriptional regulator n=1 Tax=Neorhizobium sp. CSC1952 TaxID=2978974 RepID=UPI0025A5BF9A|nr:LysR family transcriptional regulator [Rhizobium sp. CSC1952]WJR65831.1 LysR family transcriptional regulator [Rhizobium sp. CSC1952]
MDTRFLETLIAVFERGSIAEAGRHQNLSAAAVTQRIRALEAEIGQPLVIRVGRTVRPTELGISVADKARSLLNEVRGLGDGITTDPLRGTLRLGAMSTATTGLLPPVLGRLATRYPGVEAYILPGTSQDLYDRVLKGDLDAALIIEPPFGLSKTCDYRVAREENLVLLVQPEFAGADPVALLGRLPFIRYDRSTWGGMLATRWLEAAGIVPHERYELDALDAIATFVHQGLGIAIVPDWASPWPEGLSLAKLPLPTYSITRRIQLVWGRGSPRISLIRAFLEVLSD